MFSWRPLIVEKLLSITPSRCFAETLWSTIADSLIKLHHSPLLIQKMLSSYLIDCFGGERQERKIGFFSIRIHSHSPIGLAIGPYKVPCSTGWGLFKGFLQPEFIPKKTFEGSQ
jgi:hypothetical protein